MSIRVRDQNRSRKTYSFFRTKPVMGAVFTGADVPITSTTEGQDLIYVADIAGLAALPIVDLSSGSIAFVGTLRDYFFLTQTINSGSTDLIENVLASGSVGVWHRMELGGAYWKRQEEWYIDSEVGHDENIGAADKPLKTMDELFRRFLSFEKIRTDYSVTLTSVTQSISNEFGMGIELEGGSISFEGVPKFSASLGTITFVSSAINYTAATAPAVYFTGSFTGSGNNNALYVSSSAGRQFLGWSLLGEPGAIYTTPFTVGSASNTIYQAALPTIATPGINVKGYGSIQFLDVNLGSSFEPLSFLSEGSAEIILNKTGIKCGDVTFNGGNISLLNSRIFAESEAADGSSVKISNKSNVFMSSTGLIRSGSTQPRQVIDVIDSTLETPSTVFWNSNIISKSSRIILGSTVSALYSGSALASSSLEARSDSLIDVRNLIMTRSTGIPNPVKVTGQNVTVFFDDTNKPKADNVAINNGVVTLMAWASMPYQDTLRDTRVVSGSLQNVL